MSTDYERRQNEASALIFDSTPGATPTFSERKPENYDKILPA